MISVRHRFIFVHIPRTGGNSIQYALRRYSEDEITVNEKQQAHNERVGRCERFGVRNTFIGVKKHARLARIARRWNADALGPLENYVKFSSIRNPWDRLLSDFLAPYRGRTDFDPAEFETFLAKCRASQASFVSIDESFALDEVIYFEHLSEQFAELTYKLGVEAQLERANTSNSGDYRDYYCSRTRELVRMRCEKDIALFGYRF